MKTTHRSAVLISLGMLLAVCLNGGPAWSQNGTEAVQAGELVRVDVYRRPELSTTAQVDADGNIELPYVGKVHVAGKPEREAAAVVSGALRRILKNPRVTLSRGMAMYEGGGARTKEMDTQLIPLNNSAAETISNALQGMTTEGGSIGFDPHSNTLIITDTPATIQKIVQAVNRLDEMQAQRTQVRIESKIAEVKAGAMKDIGVRWWSQNDEWNGGYYPMPNQNPVIGSLRGLSGTQVFNESLGGDQRSGSTASSGISRRFVTDGPAGSGGEGRFDRRLNVPVHVPRPGQMFFGLLLDNVDVGVMLDALIADDSAELLAAPNLVTVNHRRAEIRMQDEFPYRNQTVSFGVSQTDVEFLDLGIYMEVTPHVYRDTTGTYVQLDLKPEVSFPSGSADGIPIRSVRSSEGTANVRDGQTLIIGGIYRTDLQNTEQRVPVLGKIPGVGNLFKHTERSKSQRELMVFVTPNVHESPETVTWDKMLDITRESELVGPEIPGPQARRETRKE